MNKMLAPQLVRTLDVLPAQHPRGQMHLSATSGLVLVRAGGRWHGYSVADDEHHLGHFVLAQDAPVELLRILPGDLPQDMKKRKRAKPDLECLARLPAMPNYPQGALLALGSGSKEQRHTGLLMSLNAQGLLPPNVESNSKRLDLTALYAPMHDAFDDLNIEGCFLQGEYLHLLQRGNKGQKNGVSAGSACIALDAALFQSWLLNEAVSAPHIQRIFPLDLGDAEGIPLTPTDGLALPDGRWLLSAVAENTDSSFLDGPCTGSALVLLSAKGELLALHPLQGSPKVEGIALCDSGQQGEPLSVLMVTDADDPSKASQLLRVDAFWL